MNWLLIVVVVLLAGMTILGYHRGFLKMLVSMAALVLTLVVTWYAAPKVAEVLEKHTPVYDTVRNQINEYMLTEVEAQVSDMYGDVIESVQGMQKNELLNYLTDEQEKTIIETLPIPKLLQEKMVENNTADHYDVMGVHTFCEYVSTTIADMILQAMTIVITFVVAIIMIRVAIFALDIISKIPVIHGINKLAGGLLGLMEGFFVLWILFMLITAASGTEIGREMMGMIQGSQVLTFLYDKNIFMKMVLTAALIIL